MKLLNKNKAILAGMIIFISFVVSESGLFNRFEMLFYELRVKLICKHTNLPGEIVIVLIDEATLKMMNQLAECYHNIAN